MKNRFQHAVAQHPVPSDTAVRHRGKLHLLPAVKNTNRTRAVGVLVLSLIVLASTGLQSQNFQDADSVFQLAVNEKKAVLLFFSGSDWCTNCIRFEREILQSDEFKHYEESHLLLLQADFPQRKKLPKKQVEQNEALADLYNPLGVFPTVLVLSYDTLQHKQLSYNRQSPDEVIQMIERAVQAFSRNE